MPETILANRKPFRENAEGRGRFRKIPGESASFPFIFPPGLLYYGCRRKTAPLRGVTGLFYPHILL